MEYKTVYTLIKNVNIDEIKIHDEKVNNEIKKGFIPIGATQILKTGFQISFYTSMTKG